MSYLKANLFWKNFIKNALDGTPTSRTEKKSGLGSRKKSGKFMPLKLIGLLAAIVCAALLFSLIGAWWFEA